jgi:signal transduction histidine kinase
VRRLNTSFRTGLVRFEMVITGEDRTCSADVSEQLSRIGQEAIRNAAIHANPTATRLELMYDHRSLALRVTNDGSGFNMDEEPNPTGNHRDSSVCKNARTESGPS